MLSFYIWQLHVNTLGTISFHREWQFHKGLYDTCNYMHLQGLNTSAYNKKIKKERSINLFLKIQNLW